MPTTARTAIAVVGIDIGKNSFHVVGLDDRGAIVLRQKWSRNQVAVMSTSFPLCPRIQTLPDAVGTSHLCQQQTHAPQQSASLFDHLVGPRESIGERSTPECLRSLEIDDQLKFVRKFDRQVTRLGTFEDLHDVGSRATKVISEIDAIAD